MAKIILLFIAFLVVQSKQCLNNAQAKDLSDRMERFRTVQHLIIAKVQVCYHRYQLCVSKLSSPFCLTSSGEKAFYRWAQRMASKIMNGYRDNFNFDCSPQFTRSVVHGPLKLLVRHHQ